jgi:hypothetical protein
MCAGHDHVATEGADRDRDAFVVGRDEVRATPAARAVRSYTCWIIGTPAIRASGFPGAASTRSAPG